MKIRYLNIKNKLHDLHKIIDYEDKQIIELLLKKYDLDTVPEDLLNYKVCMKCNKTKHEDEFVKWRVGLKSQGENFTIGNICNDCNDYENSEKYLKNQIDSIMEKPNYDVIKPEHIEFKATLLKLKRKLKNYDAS